MTANAQRQKRLDFIAQNGLKTKQGPQIFEVRKPGDEEYTIIGILKADPKFNCDLKFNEIKVGFKEVNVKNVFKGRAIMLDLSLICLNGEGLKLSFGTDSYEIIEPSSPIRTTVNTALAPKYNLIKVGSVAGFDKRHVIGILTGTTNPAYEIRNIKKIDTVNNTIQLVQPLDRLPIDGSQVMVIEREGIKVGENVPAYFEAQLVEIHDSSEGIFTMPHLELKKAGMPQGGMDGNAKSSDISMEVMSDFTIDENNDLLSNYLDYSIVYPTTWT